MSFSGGGLERCGGVFISPATYAISAETDDLGNWQCAAPEYRLQVNLFGVFFVHTYLLNLASRVFYCCQNFLSLFRHSVLHVQFQ